MSKRTALHDYGEKWDASDVAALRGFKLQGLTNAQIAERMGRTEAAVRTKWWRLQQAKR